MKHPVETSHRDGLSEEFARKLDINSHDWTKLLNMFKHHRMAL